MFRTALLRQIHGAMVFDAPLLEELSKALQELFAVSGDSVSPVSAELQTSSLLRCSFAISATLQWTTAW